MQNQLIEQLRPLIEKLFAVDSVWSVILRFAFWGVIAVVIIVSVDTIRPDQQKKNLKANLGLLLLFVVLACVIIYMLFGFVPGI